MWECPIAKHSQCGSWEIFLPISRGCGWFLGFHIMGTNGGQGTLHIMGTNGGQGTLHQFPLNLFYQCLALQHNLPLPLLLWVPLFGGNPLITAIGLLGLITTSASHTHHRRMYTFAPTSTSIELWD